MNPVVSIIMLTFNRERYLPESIYSVLSQTFRDLELIIVDDGSDDNTPSLVNQMNDGRIRYFKFEHTGKASKLRNFGISQSEGKFISFIDSDDVWLSLKIQTQVESLRNHPESGFTFTDVIEFTNDGTVLRNGIYKKLTNESFEGDLFDLYVQSKFVIYPSSILFDRRCLQTIGSLSELFSWTDNDFFHRLAFHYKGFFINSTMVRIRKHPENTSLRIGQETVHEMHHMLSIFFQEGMISDKIFRKMNAHYFYLSGILFLESNQRSLARKAFINCTLYNPFKVKAWIRIILSFLII